WKPEGRMHLPSLPMKPCTWLLPPCCLPPDSLALRGEASNRPIGLWLPDGWGVLQAALGPQPVEPALDLEQRAHADIALVAFAVVPDLLDDVVDPLLVDSQRLAHPGGNAEDALDCRIVAFQHVV